MLYSDLPGYRSHWTLTCERKGASPWSHGRSGYEWTSL